MIYLTFKTTTAHNTYNMNLMKYHNIVRRNNRNRAFKRNARKIKY